ncbi:MAG: bifunctional demethylmenaquinone methyltransferase/2-methoxy-6-polyprenyl-1,4-benzoquinol methylase UbiE [Deltaproteobacteria bacterium]|nr:bifunctional demethylmenaquinone methyltransferase/2-methoxy-6-polyprenyl-1,4-benzoquinol methylase UbiE [Deltaproteobacteria bacterium]
MSPSQDQTMTMTKADGSGQMFDRIAPRYDLLNRLMSFGIDRRWRKKLVRALELPAEGTVLDLASGTCDVALDVLRHYPDARVIGTDPSAKMLAIGENKRDRRGLTDRLDLAVGIAEAIELDDDSVDGTTISFGIRNVPDRPAGLREMARVTRPGGRVCILELSEPRNGIMARLARFHVHHVVPTLGALLSGSREYRYLQRSIEAFPPAEDFAALMEDCGLDVLRMEALTFGVAHLYVATPRRKAEPDE